MKTQFLFHPTIYCGYLDFINVKFSKTTLKDQTLCQD